MKFFTLVCRDIITLLMTTASLVPHTTSGGSIATYCTILIVSQTLFSHHKDVSFSAPPLALTLQMTSKFSCKYEFHALSLTVPPHLKHPFLSLPPPPIGSLPLVVELRIFPPLGLDKEILNSPRFLIPLITSETQRCYTVLTPRPHFLAQNNQEQNNATAANPVVITTYLSRTLPLPLKAK